MRNAIYSILFVLALLAGTLSVNCVTVKAETSDTKIVIDPDIEKFLNEFFADRAELLLNAEWEPFCKKYSSIIKDEVALGYFKFRVGEQLNSKRGRYVSYKYSFEVKSYEELDDTVKVEVRLMNTYGTVASPYVGSGCGGYYYITFTKEEGVPVITELHLMGRSDDLYDRYLERYNEALNLGIEDPVEYAIERWAEWIKECEALHDSFYYGGKKNSDTKEAVKADEAEAEQKPKEELKEIVKYSDIKVSISRRQCICKY